MKIKKFLNKWLNWFLGIVACILLVLIIYQNQRSKHDDIVIHTQTDGEQADLQTIQRLQSQLNDIQAASSKKTIQQNQIKNAKPPNSQSANGSGATPPVKKGLSGGEKANKSIVTRTYDPLFQRLELSTKEAKAFKRFLMERRRVWNELEQELLDGSTSEKDKESLLKELEASAWEYDQKAKELLGEENYKKYNQYNSAVGLFATDPVSQFENSLKEGEEINKTQEDQLLDAMAKEFDGFLSATVPEVKGPPGFKVGMRDEAVGSKIAENLDSLQHKYFTAAKATLSETQLRRFRITLRPLIEERKNFYSVPVEDFSDNRKEKERK
jgi:hypothetical protein